MPDATAAVAIQLACRSCGAPLERLFVDLGMSPPCEDFLTADRLPEPETFYPLDVRICDACLLVQLPAYIAPEDIFRSTPTSRPTATAGSSTPALRRRRHRAPGPGPDVAGRRGRQQRRLPAPARRRHGASRPSASSRRGTSPTVARETAASRRSTSSSARRSPGPSSPSTVGPTCVVANNVFAHIPDLNDFTAGLATLLAPGGLLSIEVAYLVRAHRAQRVRHDLPRALHVLHAPARHGSVLARHGLRVLDVEELSTHGGSLRLWVVHDDDPRPTTDGRGGDRSARERAAGLRRDRPGTSGFAERVATVKRDLLAFLIDERRRGSRIAGYGAPGKANTLLNHCGIRSDLIEYLVDRNPYKHGRFTPGTHIPILAPEHLDAAPPDVIVIMPWNLRDEIAAQLEQPPRARGAHRRRDPPARGRLTSGQVRSAETSRTVRVRALTSRRHPHPTLRPPPHRRLGGRLRGRVRASRGRASAARPDVGGPRGDPRPDRDRHPSCRTARSVPGMRLPRRRLDQRVPVLRHGCEAQPGARGGPPGGSPGIGNRRASGIDAGGDTRVHGRQRVHIGGRRHRPPRRRSPHGPPPVRPTAEPRARARPSERPPTDRRDVPASAPPGNRRHPRPASRYRRPPWRSPRPNRRANPSRPERWPAPST